MVVILCAQGRLHTGQKNEIFEIEILKILKRRAGSEKSENKAIKKSEGCEWIGAND